MVVTEQDMRSCSVYLTEENNAVGILDQRQLPNRTVFLTLQSAQEIYDAIRTLAVRGAPAIGICAGYAVYVLARQTEESGKAQFCLPGEYVLGSETRGRAESALRQAGCSAEETGNASPFLLQTALSGEYLISSRPTAVNLSWAVRRMLKALGAHDGTPREERMGALLEEAKAIHREDIEMCFRISENGLSLVKPGDGILTHCNAGPLATSKYGTALGPVFLAKERGIDLHVFSDETRPLLQGARLTSYELAKGGIDVTLICDNMASIVMKNGWVQACFVGCDRVAANGDFANKIGTSGVAILAKHYGIPFYTLGPRSTIDMNCPTGDDIRIELRDPDEIRSMWYKEPMALPEVKCYNPAFDVTDHSLVTAIVTDAGIIYPPFTENLKKIMKRG